MNRRNVMAGLAASAATGLAAYGGIIEPVLRLETTTWAPRPAQWPADLPLRIVALADIHMSPPFMTLDRLRGIVAATNALNPDIVVLLGDYAEAHGFNTRTVSPDATAAVLAGLRSPLGTWSVMGNHDWAADPRAQSLRLTRTIWHDAFETAGVEVLSNRAAPLVHRGQPFWIAGLESQLAHSGGLDDLPGTLAQVTDEAPVLLLAHEPDIFVDVPDRVALTMCGHTHGGQVRILGRAPVVPSRYGERFAYGHIVEENRHLVVSGGLGCSRAPVRLGMPPELVVIEMGNIAE